MIFPDIIIRLLEKSLPRRVFYRDYYLHSRHWKKTAAKARKNAGNKCERCYRMGVPLDVHHLSYDRLWHEKPSDLQALCRSCHNTKHG
jgi:hypothetical protein